MTAAAAAAGHGLEDTLKDLKLSSEEANKLEKAFKDPEFLKLFEEYAREVSDPKVKAENDAYLRQLETQGKVEEVYGKGVTLITPQEAFVLKTREVTGKKRKVFINVCTSGKLDKFTLEKGTNEDGRAGMHIKIPLSLGPQKLGKDKDSGEALVYDFVVHPDTAAMALTNKGVMGVTADTAMENIERVAGVKLDRAQHSMPKLKYKKTEGCDAPHVLCIRSGEGGNPVGGRLRPGQANLTDVPVPPPTSAAEASGSSNTLGGDSGGVLDGIGGKRSTFSFGKAKGSAAAGAAAEPNKALAPHQAGYRHASGETTPVWELVHRGTPDLASTWRDAGRTLPLDTPCPKELVLRATLPGVSSAASVDLDVTRSGLRLHVPSRYLLELNSLPYLVDSDKGKAKFDKAKQQLEVVLPVIPPALPSMPVLAPAPPPPVELLPGPDQQQQQQHEEQQEQEQQPQGQKQQQEEQEQGEQPAEQDEHAGQQQQQGQCQQQQQQLPQQEELSENLRRWRELHGQRDAAARLVAGQPDLGQPAAGGIKQDQHQQHQQQQGQQEGTSSLQEPQGGAAQGQQQQQPHEALGTATHSAQQALAGGNGAEEPAAVAAAAAATAAAAAMAATAPPMVQLKPRLMASAALAEELD